MIVLDATTKSLQILLSGAVTTNQLAFTASYADYIASPAAFTPGANDGITNGATPVTLVAAPAASTQRQVKRINVYNSDTAPATVTIRVVSGANNRTQLTVTLQVGERIEYEDAEGFRVFTVAGAVKVTAVQTTVEPGYIDGLQMQWVSGTAITVTSGTCYIPGSGINVNFPSSIAKAGLSLSVDTWYHIYAFLNAGVPDVEIVTTAPSSPYNGSARTKSGDTTRRYIGSVRTNGSGQIYNFIKQGFLVTYRFDISTVSRVLSAGAATVQTSVSFASFVPETARSSVFRVINTSASIATLYVYDDAAAPAFITFLASDPAPSGSVFSQVYTAPLSPTQLLQYAYAAGISSGGFYIDVIGYIQER